MSVVLCDESVAFRKILSFAIKKGNRSQDTEAIRKRLDDMSRINERCQREHLGMSRRSRFMKAKGTTRTHNVQYVKPDFVVEEVSWVLEGFQI